MQITLDGRLVIVTLSERNLASLSRGVGATLSRRTEGDKMLVITVEKDEVHYADRPEAVKRYGLWEDETASEMEKRGMS